MAFLRPEAAAVLLRWSETGAATAAVLVGLWLMRQGGYFLSPVGASVALIGAAWLLIALRRLRFGRRGRAPGLVEVIEGQIGYLGPSFGGFVALRELTEVRLVTLHGEPHWRLTQADGQVLLIPHGTEGAGTLFDAFAALPGIDLAALAAAPDAAPADRIVWQRPARAALT